MEDWQSFTTEEVFNSAVSIVRNLPKEGSVKPSDELKLKLYAYYKQATHGINDTPKPRFYQIVEIYKWDAWRKLGDMSKEEAMLCYINELKQIMESIPEEANNPEDEKRFEDVLGKKFYDYWSEQWKESSSQRQHTVNGSASSDTSRDEPTTVVVGEMGDHFAAALLRLQKSLDDTKSRVDKIENDLATTRKLLLVFIVSYAAFKIGKRLTKRMR